ncbi:MAG: Stp1/IreP family PP2C-type Ser/Thr phosphatase [Bacillota bacterium]|nr:Stp1/IreP family PP2C-type Ser/Thr phosphatase [Bacillota bacterium]
MRYGVRCDKGKVREINEDSYNILAGFPGAPTAFIIADGMGGHNSGEIASKSAVELISNNISENPDIFKKSEDVSNTLKDIIQLANVHVYKKSLENETDSGMGTTLIVAVVIDRKLYIGHVGDSRVYLIRDGKIEKLTIDHSYIEELIRNGSLTREEAENHPNKNLITRALGCVAVLEVDTYTYDIMENDVFLMCTDGLTNMLNEERILEIIERIEDPELACEKLVEGSNDMGGEDNITVIIFKE